MGWYREPRARKTSEQFKLPFQVVTLFMRTKIIRWRAELSLSIFSPRGCIPVLFHFSRLRSSRKDKKACSRLASSGVDWVLRGKNAFDLWVLRVEAVYMVLMQVSLSLVDFCAANSRGSNYGK